MKPWHFFAATGLALVFLGWALYAERGQETPPPFVPYTLVAIPILLGSGILLAIIRNVGGGRSKRVDRARMVRAGSVRPSRTRSRSLSG